MKLEAVSLEAVHTLYIFFLKKVNKEIKKDSDKSL